MLPSGIVSYNTAVTSARYLPEGPAAPHAIGSLSVYTATPHPNTQKFIQGFSWDARVWADEGIENNVASIPMILDITTSGIPSGYFQSGIGSGRDLRINSVELISSSGLSGRGVEDKWSPVIEHGYYYDFNEKAYLFSDDSEVANLTHSGVAIEAGYLANSGFNQLQLSSIPKVSVPIIAEQFRWDEDEGKYKIALSLDNKTDFTGIRNASGVRATTYDSRTDVFYWDLIDRAKTEFVPLLNETPPRLIFNNQYVTSGEDTSIGVSDGSHNQEYHTSFCPIDRTTAIEVYSYTAPSGSPTYWTPIPFSGVLTGYQAGIDYDLGLVRFGEPELLGEPVPLLGDTIGIRYWKTLRVEWEPENTEKYVEAIETNLNPIYRRGSQGFVYLRNTLEDPASITLESSSAELSLYNYGPIYLGNIPSTVTATVRDRNGQVLEDQVVTFYILSSPTVGSFGAVLSETDSPTDEEGEAKAYYHPPRTLDELGENILWSGYLQNTPSPGYTTLRTTDLSVEGAPEDIYLYKLYVDDPLQGYLDTTVSGDATSQLIEFYTKYFQSEEIYGTTGLTTSLSTSYIWVFDWYNAYKINAEDFSKVQTVSLTSPTSDGPSEYVGLWDGTNTWVTLFDSGSSNLPYLGRINGTTGTLTVFTPNAIDSYLGECCLVGNYLWLVDDAYNCVLKINTADGSTVASYPVGTFPWYICYDGTNIWVNDTTSLYKMSPSTGAVLATYALVNVGPMCFDGNDLWVGMIAGTSQVKKIRTSDGVVLATYSVGGSQACCYDGAGNVWFADFLSPELTRIRTSDGAILETKTFTSYGIGFLSARGNYVWAVRRETSVSNPHEIYQYRVSDGVLVGTGYTGGTGGTSGIVATDLTVAPAVTLTASGQAILWEEAHRTLWELAKPIIFSNSRGQGRKELACVVSASMLNPHTFAPGAVAPMQPVSVTSIGSNQYDVVFDTTTYNLPEPLASSPTPSGSLYGYFLISPTKVTLQASVWSTRYEEPIFSNKIYMHLQVPPYLSGVWIVDAINTNDLNEIAGLLNAHLTASGQRVPLGFRLRSTNVTLSSALDGITFLDVNSPWQDAGESPLLTPTQQLSDSYSPYWTSSGVLSVPTGDVVQSGIYLGQQVTIV